MSIGQCRGIDIEIVTNDHLADERKDTAAAFWLRANAWFTACGIAVRKV
jgi:hypothetical protein